MAILINAQTRVLVQGITGKEGRFWTEAMLQQGTKVVAGVTPGKEGQTVEGVPVFHTIRRALATTAVDASLLFVPPAAAQDALLETLDAGVQKVVVTTEGIPVHDALRMRRAALTARALAFGGNTTGVITPGAAMMGFFPYWLKRVYQPGRIGVMTRSGSLTNEIAAMVVKAGFGISTLVGVGGDAVPLTRFAEVLPLFQSDPDTDAVVIIGEIGGTMEEEVAEAIKEKVFTKPLVAFIAGWTAPAGKKMGHAGAIVTAGKGNAADKAEALTHAGAFVARRPGEVGQLLKEILQK